MSEARWIGGIPPSRQNPGPELCPPTPVTQLSILEHEDLGSSVPSRRRPPRSCLSRLRVAPRGLQCRGTQQVVVGEMLPRLVRVFGRELKRRLPALHMHLCAEVRIPTAGQKERPGCTPSQRPSRNDLGVVGRVANEEQWGWK